ncbi:MAG TPA: DUF5946 family protein [Chloroflexota bacterium]|nr:DUF5946 family protein [Chloroflexota bacterium]
MDAAPGDRSTLNGTGDPALRCAECGAPLVAGGGSCDDAFHQLLAWEMERPELGVVHHLLVLCFHLQHPSLYSPEALAWGRETLVDFLERGVTPHDVRQRERGAASARRTARGACEAHRSRTARTSAQCAGRCGRRTS